MKPHVETLIKSAKAFYHELKRCPNGRYMSWEHCYEIFYEERCRASPDIEKLCLHLAFYLASWGMYRGSSFLLRRDYLIHRGAIEILYSKEYDALWGIGAEALGREQNIERVFGLSHRLVKYYTSTRRDVCSEMQKDDPKMRVSSTLITKILMGTMGCCPAFDRYFVSGLKRCRFCQRFSPDTLKSLTAFYVQNEEAFGEVNIRTKKKRLKYPQMKIIDMAFWKYGFDNPSENKSKNGATDEKSDRW